MTRVLAVAAASLLGLAVGLAKADTPNPTTLTWNKQVSSIWIGEAYSRVQYQWGVTNETGCVLMDENFKGCASSGFFVRYTVSDGYIRLGIYKGRVVYIETNSPAYRSPSGLGVGSSLPYGKKIVLNGTVFRYEGAIGGWQAWTKIVPYPKAAKYSPRPNKAFERWLRAVSHQSGTFLWTDKGVISQVWIVRGDVNLQL